MKYRWIISLAEPTLNKNRKLEKILRYAQDDRNKLMFHPERSEGSFLCKQLKNCVFVLRQQLAHFGKYNTFSAGDLHLGHAELLGRFGLGFGFVIS